MSESFEYEPVVGMDPILPDPFIEQIGEMKLNLQRIRNRVNLIQAFYRHLENTKETTVRRELFHKVDIETNKMTTSLDKVADKLREWNTNQKQEISDLLSDVINEYRFVLETEKKSATERLNSALKETSKGQSRNIDIELGQNKNPIHVMALASVQEELQFEIEEQYTQILQTNRMLQHINTLFPSSSDYRTDYTVKELSELIMDQRGTRQPATFNNARTKAILAGMVSMVLVSLIIIVLIF